MKIATQVSRPCKADPKLVMACPNPHKTAVIDDRLNRRHGVIDTWLEF
jgi:hypothetical protein